MAPRFSPGIILFALLMFSSPTLRAAHLFLSVEFCLKLLQSKEGNHQSWIRAVVKKNQRDWELFSQIKSPGIYQAQHKLSDERTDGFASPNEVLFVSNFVTPDSSGRATIRFVLQKKIFELRHFAAIEINGRRYSVSPNLQHHTEWGSSQTSAVTFLEENPSRKSHHDITSDKYLLRPDPTGKFYQPHAIAEIFPDPEVQLNDGNRVMMKMIVTLMTPSSQDLIARMQNNLQFKRIEIKKGNGGEYDPILLTPEFLSYIRSTSLGVRVAGYSYRKDEFARIFEGELVGVVDNTGETSLQIRENDSVSEVPTETITVLFIQENDKNYQVRVMQNYSPRPSSRWFFNSRLSALPTDVPSDPYITTRGYSLDNVIDSLPSHEIGTLKKTSEGVIDSQAHAIRRRYGTHYERDFRALVNAIKK